MPRKNGVLSEAEAWRLIAKRIINGTWFRQGLCREVHVLKAEGQIGGFVFAAMDRRLERHLEAPRHEAFWNWGEWAYRPGTEPEARALAALWLALEAENGVKP